MIDRNQAEFIRFLQEGTGVEGLDESALGMMDQFGDEEGGAGEGGRMEMEVSEAERDSIERLVSMGFQRDVVIQTFFACDKNEELTAN